MRVTKYTLIHIVLALVTIIILKGCANTPNGAIDLSPKKPYVKEGFALELNSGRHLYEDDFAKLLIKTHGLKVAMYCIDHYQYETVEVIHKSDTTVYIVR